MLQVRVCGQWKAAHFIFENDNLKIRNIFTYCCDRKSNNFSIVKSDLRENKSRSPQCVWADNVSSKAGLACVAALSVIASIDTGSFLQEVWPFLV